MENTILSKQELNKLSSDVLSFMLMQAYETMETFRDQSRLQKEQNEELLKINRQLLAQVEDLTEKVAILTQNRFGKKTEVSSQIPGQLSFDLENMCILNEAEVLVEAGIPEEPVFENVIVRKRRTKGKRDINLKDIEVEVIPHDCAEEDLRKQFPKGWHQLEDEVYKELQYIPARFKVLEHHIKVYAGNQNTGGFLRGKAPERLLAHSILTPELAAAVFNAKYVNAVPLNRLSEEFLRNDVNIPRQDMAGWMIRVHDYYLAPMHDMMKSELMQSDFVHCDESPFIMPEHSKEYMWVFHSPGGKDAHQMYLYEYLGGRNGDVLEKYMKGYKGTLITDGYQPYHTLANAHEEIQVAGCWVHARRKFAEIVKAKEKDKPSTPAQTIAVEAVKRIDAMYHLDNAYKTSSAKERLDNRQTSIKDLADAYFAWLKQIQIKKISSDKLKTAINYSINQEPYLRTFLNNPDIPLDNNDAERSIKAFCVGKHSWHIIDSEKGAVASAFLYSLAESAKANNLKPYEYFVHILSVLVKYPRLKVPTNVLASLMPWSADLPDNCRKTKTR